MKHIDDDTLMKIALHILEEGEESALQEHLSGCADCAAVLARIRRDMELIGSLEPKTGRPYIPLPKKRSPRIHAWFKVAALLLLGFAGGYGSSRLSGSRVVTVVSYRVCSSPSIQTTGGFTSCESVDLATGPFPEAPDEPDSR